MKKCFKSLSFILSLLFLMIACKNPLQTSLEQKNSDKKTKVALTISTAVKSRLASVTKEEEENYFKSLSYTLLAVDGEDETTTLLESVSYDNLIASKPEIIVGTYSFVLNAEDDELGATVLIATIDNFEITEAKSTLHFDLAPVNGATGTVDIKILYGSNYVNNSQPEFTFKVYESKLSSDGKFVEVQHFFEAVTNDDNSTVTEEDENLYSKIYSSILQIGKYFVQIYLDDEFVGSELVYVSPNLTTHAEIRVGQPVVLNKNPDTENYATEISFNKITPDQVALFKGNKVSVTISGYPDKDFDGNFSILVYGRTESDWYERGFDVQELSLQKDTFFSSTFDIVIRNTYGNLKDQGVGLLYLPDVLNEALTINEFNIVYNDAAEFDVTTFTYHQGNLLIGNDLFKTGNEYTVEGTGGLDRLDTRYFEGWYDNPEFTGSPVTTFVADEDMDLYAKYALKIRKIEDMEDLYSSDIMLDELFEHNSVVPQRNKYFTVTTKGTLKTLVNEEFVPVTEKIPLDFYLFNPDNNWTKIEEVREDIYYEPNANGYFELTTSILVPSDFDYQTSEQLGITYSHNKDGFDGPLYIFDFDISAKVEAYEKAEREFASVETCDEGVKFTIKDYAPVLAEYTDDFVHYVEITEKTTGTSYKLNEDAYNPLNNKQNIEFVYPLLEPEQIYYFDVNIATYRDHNTYYSDLPCVSGENSLGVLNYEALDELSAVMTSDEDGKYVKINNASTDIIKSLFQTVDFEVEEDAIKFDFSILAGDKAWYNGSTQWLCGRAGPINEFAEYLDANSETGLNYLVNDYGWAFHELTSDETLKYINDKLAEYGTGWWDFGYRFALDDYPEGEFVTRRVTSEITPYEKFEKEITITFDKNDGTGSISEVTVPYGETITTPETDPVRQHYTFDGWEDFEESYAYKDVIYTAKWTPKTYTLTLNTGVYDDEGEENCIPFEVEYEPGKFWEITDGDYPIDEDSRIFLGWATEADATTAEYDKAFNNIPVEGNLTLYAVWEEKIAPSIHIEFTIPETNTLVITPSTADSNVIYAESGFNSYKWYIGSELLQDGYSNELDISTLDLDEGIYQITCLGIKGTTTADGYVVITINK